MISPKVNTFCLTYLMVSAWDGLSALPSPEAPAWEGTFFTRVGAGAFILKQLCCCHCAAKLHPRSIPTASGLQNPKGTAQELLTDAACIPKDSGAISQKSTRYPVICSSCIQHDAHLTEVFCSPRINGLKVKAKAIHCSCLKSGHEALNELLPASPSVAHRSSCVHLGSQGALWLPLGFH